MVATDHRVGPLADSLGVSERALALAGGGSSLVDAAHAAGYADQAHFGHDCLELAGVAPGRFLQDAAG